MNAPFMPEVGGGGGGGGRGMGVSNDWCISKNNLGEFD